MAIIGKFIGVAKYQDQNIRELTGARNDATALWALFYDTLADLNGHLITDTEAKAADISEALKDALESATIKDDVVIFYSGHGSHDHRLAAFDTRLDDLQNTTIPMDFLADLFKTSKARCIICILDCCFSGGAPAKVLEDSPIPRDPSNPFDALQGEGRIIIAASKADEPSYELPSTGHGILTKALLDVLQSPQPFVNLLTATKTVMDIVRTEAARMGVTQTPVVLSHITGGLSLPSLKPGTEYFSAFPKKAKINISNDIDDLLKVGLPAEIIKEWKTQFKDGLNELQLKAVNEYGILNSESLLVIAPTSSGKTFIGELASICAITEGRKAVFLLPYKALVNEKYEQFAELYGNKCGYRIIRCTGDYLDQNSDFIKGKYDIAFFTYEMFLNLSVSIPATLNSIGLIVLDEAHFIADPTRGIVVELLLTNIIASRNNGINPQLITLSAVIGNSNYFEEWLGCKKLVTDKRPVPLIEGVFDRSGRFKYLDSSGGIQQQQLLPPGSVYQRKSKPSAQDMIIPLVKQLVQSGEKVIIFRNQRGAAEGCAAYLSKELGLTAAIEEAKGLPKHSSSSKSSSLREAFMGGAAFHNTNLTREERVTVERAFRNPDSKIKVLAATTTVAAGINTPASTVILAEQEFKGEDGRPFTVAEYKNMAGRAGRVGYNEEGKAILLADAGHDSNVLFGKYVLGKVNDLSSSFQLSELDTWVIRLLAQIRKGVSRDKLVGLLTNTYGGYFASRNNPEWARQIGHKLIELYNQMLKLDLIEEENDFVHLTLLGKACGESVFSFRSAMRLVELLKSYTGSPFTAEALMAIVQALPETDAAYTPMFKRGTFESKYIREAQMRYGNVIRLLQKYANGDEFRYYARCKRAAVLFDWVSGNPTQRIEETFKSKNPYSGNIGYGDIRSFADLTRFQLRSAYKIAFLIFPDQTFDEENLESLLKQLEVGIPADCLGLLDIPVQMAREEYLALRGAGIIDAQSLLSTGKEVLENLLESSTMSRLALIMKNNRT